MPKFKIMTVFGTRPEAIKMAPVIKELEKHNELFESIVCTTSQHKEMLQPMLKLFRIEPDIDLQLMRDDQTLSSLTSSVMSAVTETLSDAKPDAVLVQGDTTTAAITALASFYQKIAIGHIEAGLRTHDLFNPFPEEANRKIISAIATFNFAPTPQAAQNLKTEGIAEKRIVETGNTIVDALYAIDREYGDCRLPVNLSPDKKTILVTAHRRENFGQPLINICNALKIIIDNEPNVEIVYPVHLNPHVRDIVYKHLGDVARIHLLTPLDYHDLVQLMKQAHIILTDSGGVQEEAPTFGKPVLVMRKTTERPEGVEAGVAKLVGTDVQNIVDSVMNLLKDENAYREMAHSVNPYGDGHAASRIVNHLAKFLATAQNTRE